MAEALGLASSIVALVQLSTSVYTATSKFYREAKDAKSKINALATQIRNLSGVLQSLSLLASAPLFDDFGVSSPDFRDTYIESCHSTLQKIKRKLEKAENDIEGGSRRKVITRSLKWPFAAQETEELVAELNQHRDILQLALSADTMSQLLQCLANTESTAKSIHLLNQKFDRKASIDTRATLTAKRDEIVRFFLKVNPQEQLQDCRNRRQPNTGRWLIERNETFRDWLSSSGSQIWLSGIPGAGKTILCGTVIDEILQLQTISTAAAFFFCDYKSTQSQEPVSVLSALAVQLAQQSDEAFELLESYYEALHPQNGLAKQPQTNGMVEVAQAMIKEYDGVYLVIDGLDECGPEAVEVIRALNQLAEGDQVTMALFSRNEPDIADELSESLHIEIAAHTEDIELYVLAQMDVRKRLGGLALKNAALHEYILRTLIQGANGMFRWVACQLDYLDGLPNDARRRKALTELPPTLFETYDRILDRIMQEDDHGQEICRKSLHWIGLGCNISAEALCEAVSIPDDGDTIDKELFVDAEWVSRRCSSLIRLAGQEPGLPPHFQLAHFTVKEYLRSIQPESKRGIFSFSEEEAIQKLCCTSLRFLTFRNFDEMPTLASSEIQRMVNRNEQHPFYPFAAGYIFFSGSEIIAYRALGNIEGMFGNQFSKVLRNETMMKCALKLFNPDKTGMFLSWVLQAIWNWPQVDLCGANFSTILGLLMAPEFSTLHIAASLALPSICSYLLDTRRIELNMGCRLGTPLHALLAGVSIYRPRKSTNFEYDKNSHYRLHPGTRNPAYNEARQCLEAFVRHSVDTSARWGSVSCFQMAINNAIREGGLWLKPLITPSAAIDEGCINDFKTLSAIYSVDGPFFDAILALGSIPDTPPMLVRLAFLIQTSRIQQGDKKESGIPFQTQSLSDEDFSESVRISLAQNLTNTLGTLMQDPRFSPNTFITFDTSTSEPILHFAIRAGSPKLLEMLLEGGCDPKVVDEHDGWTGLHQCAWWNTNDAANALLLLESGVMDSIKNVDGETCWHIAAKQGNIAVLKVLIQRGSDTAKSLGTTSMEGRTPLASAVLSATAETALLLLNNCNAELEVFQSDEPLLAKAVATGSEELLPQLYEKMKQAGTKETLEGSKPLNSINMDCSPKLVDYLLTTWDTDNRSRSEALVNYLLDANHSEFEYPDNFPERTDLNHVITQLLPPVGATEDQSSPLDFWSIFCDKVVVNLTRSCDHIQDRCRNGLVNMIFEILIEARVLDSYERNLRLPSYRTFFQALLDRGKDLGCSWIPSSVQQVIKASTLSKDIANDAAGEKLLSLAVRQSTTNLVKQLLEQGISVHSCCEPLSPVEQVCYSSDLPTFAIVMRHADGSHINKAGNQGKTLLHCVVSGNGPERLSKIRHLLKLGADIDAKVDDPDADTALTLAARSNLAPASDHHEILQLLVSEGANSMHRGRDGWSLLHAAALTGDLRYLQSLDRSHVPASYWQGTCECPLVRIGTTGAAHITQSVTVTHLAAAQGRTNFLRFMAQHNLPLDVNAVTGFPAVTPLNLASTNGHLDVVEFLVAAKANVNARNAYKLLPIDLAARGGHMDIVKLLLNSGSEMPSRSSRTSITSLMSKGREGLEIPGDSKAMSEFIFEQAIRNGDLHRCRKMVESGQSINAELFTHSYTPLVLAMVKRQTAVVDWLISSGVEVRIPRIASGRLHPALRCIASLATHHISSSKTLSNLVALALKQGVNWYGTILGPLHVAILADKMEALEVILNHIRNNDNAYRQMIETELICVPADIFSWRGRAALSILVNSFNRVEALSGNPPWRQRLPPGSPLHWAIRNNNIHAVRSLLRNEADVNQADSSGWTPLNLAVLSQHPIELVQELLQAGAGLAEPRLVWNDAVGHAIRTGNLDLVKILAEADPETLKGLDSFSRDIRLQNAGSAAVFQYLISRGCNPTEMKKMGQSAVTGRIAPNCPWSGFVLNSGLVIQSSEGSLAFALIWLVWARGPRSIRLAKMLCRVLPNEISTKIVNWTGRGIASPMCWAASENSAGMIEGFISLGTDLEGEGCRDGSPLMAACAWGNLDVARRLVRAGALLCYVNEQGKLRSAISAASRYPKVVKWLLVDRHMEQPKIDYQPSRTTSHQPVWSGPRLFKLALPAYMHRDVDESSWDYLQRLEEWRKEFRGSALAESRRDSGMDLDADFEAESKIRDAEAAHHRFLKTLGEVRYE